MTSHEMGGTSQKVSNLGIYLCFEPRTLNSWVYNKKPILVLTMDSLSVFSYITCVERSKYTLD